MNNVQRRLPIGAELLPEGGGHFRVWSTLCSKIEVILEDAQGKETVFPLSAEGNDYFSGTCAAAGKNSRYRYRLDGGESFPDPASRFQPDGPHGSSQVIDPDFTWTDDAWRGVTNEGQVLYEMHIGTFTREGTWQSAADHLPGLADLGITVVEVMPVAEFPGRFGWGYDGVNLFAPTRLYGEPDDFRHFVDRAHGAGIGVILDVVYNHFGPEGNYLKPFSLEYFTDRYETEWGEAVNFDGADADPVREFFVANAAYWISEFHLDGLRLDATQQMFDNSPRHILACITERVREVAGRRTVYIAAENEPQRVRLLEGTAKGGYGIDAVWNDDFHHSAHVAATGDSEAYYSEYRGTPQELISAVKWSYLYQGQRYFWQEKERGAPTLGLSPSRFINYLQNHDQIANSAWGRRLHQVTSPGRFRAITALLLLSPATPLLFQGQEFAASAPFLYFADLSPDVGPLVRTGRIDFLRQFPNIASPEVLERLPDPTAPETFERCRLDSSERESHGETYLLHRDLLRLRRADPVFREACSGSVEGAVLGPEAFLIRYFKGPDQRLLLVNLGPDLRLSPAPEPLLAPPEKCRWQLVWSSEKPEYGGSGSAELETKRYWRIQGHAAVVLKPILEGTS